jgi:hypothetical protein
MVKEIQVMVKKIQVMVRAVLRNKFRALNCSKYMDRSVGGKVAGQVGKLTHRYKGEYSDRYFIYRKVNNGTING